MKDLSNKANIGRILTSNHFKFTQYFQKNKDSVIINYSEFIYVVRRRLFCLVTSLAIICPGIFILVWMISQKKCPNLSRRNYEPQDRQVNIPLQELVPMLGTPPPRPPPPTATKSSPSRPPRRHDSAQASSSFVDIDLNNSNDDSVQIGLSKIASERLDCLKNLQKEILFTENEIRFTNAAYALN